MRSGSATSTCRCREQAVPAGIVCVQNAYNLLDRRREDMLGYCAEHGIAWVPYFPLGSAFPGFPKVADNDVVRRLATETGSTPQHKSVWRGLLAHSPNILPIPGTGSIAHLEENLAAGNLTLSDAQMADLDAVPGAGLSDGDGVEAFLDEGR